MIINNNFKRAFFSPLTNQPSSERLNSEEPPLLPCHNSTRHLYIFCRSHIIHSRFQHPDTPPPKKRQNIWFARDHLWNSCGAVNLPKTRWDDDCMTSSWCLLGEREATMRWASAGPLFRGGFFGVLSLGDYFDLSIGIGGGMCAIMGIWRSVSGRLSLRLDSYKSDRVRWTDHQLYHSRPCPSITPPIWIY